MPAIYVLCLCVCVGAHAMLRTRIRHTHAHMNMCVCVRARVQERALVQHLEGQLNEAKQKLVTAENARRKCFNELQACVYLSLSVFVYLFQYVYLSANPSVYLFLHVPSYRYIYHELPCMYALYELRASLGALYCVPLYLVIITNIP